MNRKTIEQLLSSGMGGNGECMQLIRMAGRRNAKDIAFLTSAASNFYNLVLVQAVAGEYVGTSQLLKASEGFYTRASARKALVSLLNASPCGNRPAQLEQVSIDDEMEDALVPTKESFEFLVGLVKEGIARAKSERALLDTKHAKAIRTRQITLGRKLLVGLEKTLSYKTTVKDNLQVRKAK